MAVGLCANFYTVTITDANNCITVDTVTINTNGLNLTITNVIPESCFGACDGIAVVSVSAGTTPYTYQWNVTNPVQTTPTATNLCVGTYTAVVTDSLNCADSISATVTGPTQIVPSITITTPISCNGGTTGTANLTVSGGTPTYTYNWSNSVSTEDLSGLSANTYTVTVTDNLGCTVTSSVVINEPTAVTAT
ncbi:MAG: adhesin, partial [Flavobacteriales bacterium CG_4_10_14_0_8_um_filter_32_5]